MEDSTLRILVVDDDAIDRLKIQRELHKAGLIVTIVEAQTCAEAIALVQAQTFDGAFLDYRLPDGDALTLVKQIKGANINLPLIVLTGQGDEQIAVELMKAGAADYLVKDRVSGETLERVLQSAMRVYRAEAVAKLADQKLRLNNQVLLRQNRQLEQQQRQIEQQNRELAEASRLKSDFLAMMSHELRTPMNAVMGFSQLLLQGYPDPLNEQQLNMVQRIFDNSQKLLDMLNEVLDFSKIESGRFQLSSANFSLELLVRSTLAELQALALQKDLQLQIDFQLSDSEVCGDEAAIRRILINLISNAIKFTETGNIVVRVADIEGDRILMTVKDTGIGIPAEQLLHIFEPFRQVDQTITRQQGGTGLGLAIIHALVEAMQGTIEVNSTVGEGSEFQIVLPRIMPDSTVNVSKESAPTASWVS